MVTAETQSYCDINVHAQKYNVSMGQGYDIPFGNGQQLYETLSRPAMAMEAKTRTCINCVVDLGDIIMVQGHANL